MRASPLAVLLALVPAGCSYDWAYADASGDASADAPDGGVPDATRDADAPGDTTSTVDTSTDATDAEAGVTDAEAAAEVSLPTCTAADLDAVHQKLAQALDCTGVTPNPCQVLVKDECGCSRYVAINNQAAADYIAAVKQLLQKCTPNCPPSCNPASMGLCYPGDGGAGTLSCH
jgi:hypothetical protein